MRAPVPDGRRMEWNLVVAARRQARTQLQVGLAVPTARVIGTVAEIVTTNYVSSLIHSY